MTPFVQLPQGLLAELAMAGLDPEEIYRDILRALEEDLPGGSVDVTSAATIAADARGVAAFAAREAGVVAGLGIAAQSSPWSLARTCRSRIAWRTARPCRPATSSCVCPGRPAGC